MNIKDHYMRDLYIDEKSIEYIHRIPDYALLVHKYTFRLVKNRYDKFFIFRNVLYREAYFKDKIISAARIKI